MVYYVSSLHLYSDLCSLYDHTLGSKLFWHNVNSINHSFVKLIFYFFILYKTYPYFRFKKYVHVYISICVLRPTRYHSYTQDITADLLPQYCTSLFPCLSRLHEKHMRIQSAFNICIRSVIQQKSKK